MRGSLLLGLSPTLTWILGPAFAPWRPLAASLEDRAGCDGPSWLLEVTPRLWGVSGLFLPHGVSFRFCREDRLAAVVIRKKLPFFHGRGQGDQSLREGAGPAPWAQISQCSAGCRHLPMGSSALGAPECFTGRCGRSTAPQGSGRQHPVSLRNSCLSLPRSGELLAQPHHLGHVQAVAHCEP